MKFLHCFTYYILYEKHFFKEIIFHEYSPSHFLCFELIHRFPENFKYYFWVHVTLGLLISIIFESMSHSVRLIQKRGPILEAEGEIFIDSK